ncbi:MAG: hypothetical protein ACHQM6_10445, partial [Candidatus Kapaibacterium sp.]
MKSFSLILIFCAMHCVQTKSYSQHIPLGIDKKDFLVQVNKIGSGIYIYSPHPDSLTGDSVIIGADAVMMFGRTGYLDYNENKNGKIDMFSLTIKDCSKADYEEVFKNLASEFRLSTTGSNKDTTVETKDGTVMRAWQHIKGNDEVTDVFLFYYRDRKLIITYF